MLILVRSGRDLVRLREMGLIDGQDGMNNGGTDCDIKMSPDYFCPRNSSTMMLMMLILAVMLCGLFSHFG